MSNDKFYLTDEEDQNDPGFKWYLVIIGLVILYFVAQFYLRPA